MPSTSCFFFFFVSFPRQSTRVHTQPLPCQRQLWKGPSLEARWTKNTWKWQKKKIKKRRLFKAMSAAFRHCGPRVCGSCWAAFKVAPPLKARPTAVCWTVLGFFFPLYVDISNGCSSFFLFFFFCWPDNRLASIMTSLFCGARLIQQVGEICYLCDGSLQDAPLFSVR